MGSQDKDRLRCDCGQSFSSQEELQQHQRTCPTAMRKQQGGKVQGAGGGQSHQG